MLCRYTNHPPTIRQLQFLVALADEGSFSKAATACHVTQPTLSAAIREVEGLLGVQLVERQARGAELTPSGEVVVDSRSSSSIESAILPLKLFLGFDLICNGIYDCVA